MMVWNSNIFVESGDESGLTTNGDTHQPRGQERGIPAVQYLLNAIFDVVARLGVRSVAVALVVAIVVAAILFGLSADEASAGINLCIKC